MSSQQLRPHFQVSCKCFVLLVERLTYARLFFVFLLISVDIKLKSCFQHILRQPKKKQKKTGVDMTVEIF